MGYELVVFINFIIIPFIAIIVAVLLLMDKLNINQSNLWLENTIVCWGKPSPGGLQNKKKWAWALLIGNSLLFVGTWVFIAYGDPRKRSNFAIIFPRLLYFIYVVTFIILVPWGIWWNETRGFDLSPRLKEWFGLRVLRRHVGWLAALFVIYIILLVLFVWSMTGLWAIDEAARQWIL